MFSIMARVMCHSARSRSAHSGATLLVCASTPTRFVQYIIFFAGPRFWSYLKVRYPSRMASQGKEKRGGIPPTRDSLVTIGTSNSPIESVVFSIMARVMCHSARSRSAHSGATLLVCASTPTRFVQYIIFFAGPRFWSYLKVRYPSRMASQGKEKRGGIPPTRDSLVTIGTSNSPIEIYYL